MSCLRCVGGQFQERSGQTECKSCVAGQYSQQGNQSLYKCERCDPGHYSGAASSSCKFCPAGKFSKDSISETGEIPVHSECEECGIGLFQSEVAQQGCFACPTGQSAERKNDTGSSGCLPCTKGTFTNSTASIECSDCPAGYFQSGLYSTDCIPCPAGRYNGFSRATDIVDCKLCPEFTTSPEASYSITNCVCAAGSYNVSTVRLSNETTDRGSECQLCPIGSSCSTQSCPLGSSCPDTEVSSEELQCKCE